MTRKAGCSCGQLSVVVTGQPLRISICHCLDCQKRTGSVFGAQSWFAGDSVTIEGQSTQYDRVADSGNSISFHFCPSCGSTVYYEAEIFPGRIAVPVGAFGDPEFPSPGVSVYEARKHPWVKVPVEIEHFD